MRTSIAFIAFLVTAVPAAAEELYNKDGVQLWTSARLVTRDAATCHILEDRHPDEEYRRLKANEGQPLHVWRMDLRAANYSGKTIEYVRASVDVESEWPPCTTWDWNTSQLYPRGVIWAGGLLTFQDVGEVLAGLAQADSGSVTAGEAIEELLSAQIVLRNNRRLEAAMRSSRLPAVKTLGQFDFSFQPSIKREQIESLHELGFVERAENVILLGPPGVGKTHLAISLAIAAAESGRKVYYGTLAALIESLTEAKAAGNLSRRLRVLTHPALLVVDEIGYLPVSQDGAVLFFHLINARHERASTVQTSNKGFKEWGGVLGDEIMAAALIDRLLHHCHIVSIRGNSYRMRAHQDLFRTPTNDRRQEDAP